MVGCQGVDVGASLIEVTPHLINVGPFGAELSIDLPGAISVEDVGIEVRAAILTLYIFSLSHQQVTCFACDVLHF